MAGDGQVQVVAAELRKHAGSVDAVAGEIDVAHDAAAHVQMGHDAYGVLPVCMAIARLLDPIQDMGVDALTEAADALRSSADAVRQTADSYDGTDQSVATTFRLDGLDG